MLKFKREQKNYKHKYNYKRYEINQDDRMRVKKKLIAAYQSPRAKVKKKNLIYCRLFR